VTDVLGVTDAGAVRTLTLDRPAARNAFDVSLYSALAAALDEARNDDGVHVVVLTGAGPVFSAGQDLDEMTALASGTAPDGAEHGFRSLLAAVEAFDKPLLAAVNGPGVGIGFTLLLHCDLVWMAESARLRVPFAEMGVPPEAGSSLLLARRVGRQQASRILLTGAWVGAEEAVDLGLALAVVPDDALLDEVGGVAAQVAAHPLAGTRAVAGLVRAAEADDITAARRREEDAFADLLASFTRPDTAPAVPPG
jgi:enoyl-CoA hydratase/carnithine racemase